MFSSHVSTVWFCCSISPIAPPVLSNSFHCLLGSDFCEVEMLNLLSPYSSIPPVGLLKPEPSALAASCAAPCPRRDIDISWRTSWMPRVGHLPSYQGDIHLERDVIILPIMVALVCASCYCLPHRKQPPRRAPVQSNRGQSTLQDLSHAS